MNRGVLVAVGLLLVCVIIVITLLVIRRDRRGDAPAQARAVSNAVKASRRPRRAKTRPPKRSKRATAPLSVRGPKKTPHPDYPTAKRAKTNKLFVFEEPDRGAVLTSAPPPAKHDRVRRYRYCELDHDRVICAGRLPKRRGASGAWWRVASAKGKVVLAARLLADRVDRSYVFVRKGARLEAIVKLDTYNTVQWSRHFDGVGKVYTSRERSGANQLDGCGKIRLTHDKRGRVSAAACLQWSGAPMLDVDGVHRRRYRRDARGFATDRLNDGLDGKASTSHDGVHRVSLRRDQQGRVTARIFRDSSGLATLSARQGCYGFKYRYDERGLYVGRICLDGEGKRAGGRDGLAAISYTNNARGCLIAEQRHYDTPSSSFRRHRREYVVDQRCERTIQMCYDEKRARARCGPGEPAEVHFQRDAKGQLIAAQHFDSKGRPGRDALYHVFELRYGYDARGNRVRLRCFAPRNVAVPCGRTGFHEARSSYDDAGRMTSQRFYDTRGNRASNLRTYERRYRYDNYDHLAGTINLGLDGKLTSSLGESKRRYIYDAGHRMFGMLLYDRLGRPARYRGCIVGRTCPTRAWHAMRVVRRLDGSVVSNLFFDHEGQLIFTVDCGKKRCWR